MLIYIFNLHSLHTHLAHCHCIHCLSAMSYKRTIIHVCPCLQSTHCPYISLIYYPNTRQTRNAANNKYSTKPISCSDFPLPSIFNAHCPSLFYCSTVPLCVPITSSPATFIALYLYHNSCTMSLSFWKTKSSQM